MRATRLRTLTLTHAHAPTPIPWIYYFLAASVGFCVASCLASWVICLNLRSPTGDVLRDAVLAAARPQERKRRRAMIAVTETTEMAEVAPAELATPEERGP